MVRAAALQFSAWNWSVSVDSAVKIAQGSTPWVVTVAGLYSAWSAARLRGSVPARNSGYLSMSMKCFSLSPG